MTPSVFSAALRGAMEAKGLKFKESPESLREAMNETLEAFPDGPLPHHIAKQIKRSKREREE